MNRKTFFKTLGFLGAGIVASKVIPAENIESNEVVVLNVPEDSFVSESDLNKESCDWATMPIDKGIENPEWMKEYKSKIWFEDSEGIIYGSFDDILSRRLKPERDIRHFYEFLKNEGYDTVQKG